MTIDASMVMKLREATGLGMMLCKKALTETNGDMEKAIEMLRKQGQATAAKRAGKAAKEGKVSILTKEEAGLIYEINCETDFVARNDDFLSLSNSIGNLIFEKKPATVEAALSLKAPEFNNHTAEEKLLEITGKIGEKIFLRRFQLYIIDPSKEKLYSYIHGNGKIGVLLVLQSENAAALQSPSFAQLGKDMAMQIAASKPIAVDRTAIPASLVAKEKEIYFAQAQSSGKPEKMWEKIVEGKISKFYQQAALLEQEYIRDTAITVANRIHQTEEELHATIRVHSFTRYELGAEE